MATNSLGYKSNDFKNYIKETRNQNYIHLLEYISNELKFKDNNVIEIYKKIVEFMKELKMYKINDNNVNGFKSEFNFILNLLSIKDINEISTTKEKIITIYSVINLIDYIINTKKINKKNDLLYVLFRYCLPYICDNKLILNRTYQPLFFNNLYWKTNEIKFDYLYDDGSNPSNKFNGIFDEKDWLDYKLKLLKILDEFKEI